MNLQNLKTAMDRLRAAASRGAVPASEVFAVTDPIMDEIERERRSPDGGDPRLPVEQTGETTEERNERTTTENK